MNPRGRPKGSPRPPGSGRKKGTPNKDRFFVREQLYRLGFDPLEDLVSQITLLPPDLRVKADLELLEYLSPKLRATDLTIEKIPDESQNEKLDELHAELRTMLLDRMPKDIECSLSNPGSILPSQSEAALLPSPSPTEPLKRK